MFAFSIISQHLSDIGSAIVMEDMDRFVDTCTLAAGDLAMLEARASAAIVLI